MRASLFLCFAALVAATTPASQVQQQLETATDADAVSDIATQAGGRVFVAEQCTQTCVQTQEESDDSLIFSPCLPCIPGTLTSIIPETHTKTPTLTSTPTVTDTPTPPVGGCGRQGSYNTIYGVCVGSVEVCANRAVCAGLVTPGAANCGGLGVACPTTCTRSSSSKKGLLGLLGLLGLIPLLLCLLLCCGLLCCRRTKAAPDVHFATFDPATADAHCAVAMPCAIPTACGTTTMEPCFEQPSAFGLVHHP